MFRNKLSTALIAALSFGNLAFAQTDLSIVGAGRLIPIAVPQLCTQAGEQDPAKEIPKVMARDLDLSGLFEVLNPGSYIETPGKCLGPDGTVYSDWSVIGTEGLVRGTVTNVGGRVRVQLYLHDVQRQRAVLGKEYEGDLAAVPSMAHKFANEIMKFFTGQYGVFGTEIAYTSRVGRFKELFVMDMDGGNIRQITNDRGLAISSAWIPNRNSLIYTTYRNRVPDLFTVDLNTRRISQITRTDEMELGAEPSPVGGDFLVSRTRQSDSDILLMSFSGQVIKNLTPPNGAIDVSPSWSGDGSKVAFCSNRAGGPQIYVMGADGSGVRRISFVSSNYCTSPAYSPKSNKVAFVCRAEGNFQLFVANDDGSNALQLTSFGSNEDPSWAPNGEYIAIGTTFGKGRTFHIGIIRPDGTNLRQLTHGSADDTQPAWGPYTN